MLASPELRDDKEIVQLAFVDTACDGLQRAVSSIGKQYGPQSLQTLAIGSDGVVDNICILAELETGSRTRPSGG